MIKLGSLFDGSGGFPPRRSALRQGVRDTQAAISGKPPKTYSAASLTKWYNSLHTDSAEYKMWGNGIALPCAAFVLEGVAEKMEGGAAGNGN